MLEKMHNWIYFHYGVSIATKTLAYLIALIASLLFLLFSLLANGSFKSSVPSSLPKGAVVPAGPAGAGMPIPR
ncbi:MAG: hypothetical protein US63_C0007G0039 [Candidatus Moranbacteria bacterium GW2011_GWC2_37_8]|nr:MAG: hypothetical protein US63_C0007G0039 [Candidatus Moranbacteria bacterium GW2011_GWC2_37_8]KKQ62763.1 MAG: hypothetical protein US82_C0006G0011 [Parcubacteria group bacterium GW2011_GWC1_38_22]